MHYDSGNNSNYGAVLKIYGDDKLLYTSPVMKAGVLPLSLNVDVSGVVKLKVQVEIPDFADTLDQSAVYFGLVDTGLLE